MITARPTLEDIAAGIDDGTITTLDRDLLDFPYPRGLMAQPLPTTRGMIAAVSWRVVAEFIGDYAPITAPPGDVLAEVCERYVREHAEEAEGETLTSGSATGALITPVMHRLGLLDDYMRMKRGEQWMVFESEPEQ